MSKSFSTSEKIPIDKKSRQLKRRKGLDEKLKELHVSSTPSSSVPIPYGINQSMMRANLIENEKFAGKVINLSNSKLRIIMQKEMKENVHNASTLDLSDNLLIALPVFLQLGNIKILILRGNRLEKFEIQNKMDHLMVLNLSSNYLTEFPKKETIALMPLLRKLLLHNNKITEINISSIYALSKINIEVLNVSLNKIVVIPKELGLLNTLTSLNLSNNDITELPIEILKLRQLYAAIDSLDIRGNKLVRPPQEIAQRKGLFSIKDYFDSIVALRNASGSKEYEDTEKISGRQGSLLTDFSKLQPFQTVKSRHLKLVMVGHENAGKSTIVRMLKHSNNGLSGGNYGGGSSYNSFNSLSYSDSNTFSGDNSGGNSTKSIYDMGPLPAVETGEEDIDREEDAGRLYSSSGFLIDQKLRDAAAKSCARFFPSIQQTQSHVLSEQTQQQTQQPQQDVKINIWNFVGREIYRTSHEMFFSANALHMVVWDVEKSSSCIDYDTYIQFWIDLIQARAPGSTIMIVATHTDILDIENEALLGRYWQQYNNKNRNNNNHTESYHNSPLNTNYHSHNSSTIPVVSREDLLQFIISEMQSHLQYNESLRISDLTCDITHLQSLPLRTEYDDEKIELLSKLLVNRPNIHPVVVPLATLDTDLRGIYQLINEIVQLTTPSIAPIISPIISPAIAPAVATNYDTNDSNKTTSSNISGNNDNNNNNNDMFTLMTPVQQGNPHPFNILNIDIPLYYHLVKQQIDELRRRKTCGNSYCTIEELSNSVRAVQLGSSLYGNSNNNNSSNSSNSSNNGGDGSAITSPNRASKRLKKLNKRNKQKITEERQAVLESYERTKNAIVYWATVGEIIWFPSSTSSEEDEYDSLYYTQLQHSHLEQYIESALDASSKNDNMRNDNGSEKNDIITANTTSSNNKKLNSIDHIEQNNRAATVITRTNTSSSSNTGVFTATKQEELVFYTPRTDDIPITSYQHNYYNIIDEYYSNNSYDSSINSSSLPMNRYNRKRFDSDASGLSLTSVPSVTARNSEFYSENENELQYELDDYNHNNSNSNSHINSNSNNKNHIGDGSDCSDDENVQTNTTNNTNKHNKVLRSLHNTLSQQQHKYNKSRINRQRSNSIDTYNTNNTIETEGSDFSDDDDRSYYVPVGVSSSDTDQCNLDKVDRKDNCDRNSDRNSDSDSDSDEESDCEDRELDRSLLSSIVFLSPGWLKDSMKGLLDQDIRQKIADIEKLASKADMMRYFGTEGHTSSNHFNGVVQWDLIKELLLSGDSSASTSSLLQRMKHDTEKLEETLEILREVLIRLNIIIPIEKIRTPQEASYEYYDDYAISNNNSDRFGTNNYNSSSEKLDSSGDLVLEDDLHYTNRTHASSGKLNNKLAINTESRELHATNNTNNTTNRTTAYLLPSLLSEPSEKDTQQVIANFAAIDSIRLERRYSFSRFIPSNIVPRIIAKMYSKYGYVLKTNDYSDNNNDNFSTYDNQHDHYNEDESDGNTTGDKNMSETDKNKCWSNTFIQEFGDCTVWVLFGPMDTDCPPESNNSHTTNDQQPNAITTNTNTANSNNSVSYHSSSNNMCGESKGEQNWTASEAHYFTTAAATSTVTENIKSSKNINNNDSNNSSNTSDTTTTSSTKVNTMQLRIISYGHLLHVQSVVKSLDHYSKVIDEILSEYKGISTLSSTTLCPVCQMKQYNDDECGIITNTIETNLRQSIYQLCNNNSYYLDLDSTEDVELLKGQYKTWDAENRVICNRHHCNIKPEFLIELPERITELFDPDETYRNMTSYIRDDIINRSLSERESARNNTQNRMNKQNNDDTTFVATEIKSLNSVNSTGYSAQGTITAATTPVPKEDISDSMVHVLPLHTTSAQLEELNKLFANRLNKRLSISNNNENGSDGRVAQQDFFFWKVVQQVKVGDIMSGVRVKHPFRGGNNSSSNSSNNSSNSSINRSDGNSASVSSKELFILTAFIATRPAEVYQYFLIGDSRGWQHIAQYIIRPPKKIPGGYASDAALLRVFAVIDAIPINISNNILDIRIKYTPAFLYRDESIRLYANSSSISGNDRMSNSSNNSDNNGSSTGGVTTIRMCSLSIALEDNELQVEQVVQVWGFNGMSLNDGNWARIVLRTGECCLISLYSDQNLLGGPVLNEKGNILGVFSKHIYKNSTQSAYFVASIRSLLM